MPPPTQVEFRKRKEFLKQYRVNKPLGKGGFGCVFAGVRKSDGLLVAIKRVPWVGLRRWETTEKNERIPIELSLLQKASDIPGVIQLVDFCRDEGGLVLVMEYDKNASSIQSHLEKNGAFPEPETIRILRQLIPTLLGCQRKLIFHRDVKVDNLLYNKTTGKVTLIDFGVGVMVGSPTQSIRPVAGTPAYSPPEYFLAGYSAAEPTTVWSLGCLAYCMIFGKIPFRYEDEIMNNRIVFCPNIVTSNNARSFIRQCLRPEAERRPTLLSLLEHPWLTEEQTQQDNSKKDESQEVSGTTPCLCTLCDYESDMSSSEDTDSSAESGEEVTSTYEFSVDEDPETVDGTSESQTVSRGTKRSFDDTSSETRQSKRRRAGN